MKTATTVTLILLAAASLLLAACTAEDDTADQDLVNARATAQAAFSERDDALINAPSPQSNARRTSRKIRKPTFEVVKQRGEIVCATGNDTPGFYSLDQAGQSIGFDVDLCRAVAAAVAR